MKGRQTLQTCTIPKDLPLIYFLRKLLEMCSTKARVESKKEENINVENRGSKKEELNELKSNDGDEKILQSDSLAANLYSKF